MQLLSLALVLSATVAHAQADHAAAAAADDDEEVAETTASPTSHPTVIWQPVTTMDEGDFRALDVEGRLVAPGVELVDEIRHARGFDFIALRADFDRELHDSVDVIR